LLGRIKMIDLLPVRRALISVSDKRGIIELSQSLVGYGIELISTGGTFKVLKSAGLKVTEIDTITGYPEMMDGRVKTLHPNVHGGLLALRDSESHIKVMADRKILGIDLLIVNLYPFEKTVVSGADYETCIENIDIGGPAMLRSGSKNHKFVSVVTDIEDYELLLRELSEKSGKTSYLFRRSLSLTAFSVTASYDSCVSTWMSEMAGETPRRLTISGKIVQTLRYGENPHQTSAFYQTNLHSPGITNATKWQGKELSYNNINDTDAALNLIYEFDTTSEPACAIIKHANPCGVAIAETLREAYLEALKCDQMSAFGGVIALNQVLDEGTAKEIVQLFTEVVIAPEVTDGARKIFENKKNLRLITTDNEHIKGNGNISHFRSISGGFLFQSSDIQQLESKDLKVVTKRTPTDLEKQDLLFAWKVAKHVKSNAIVYAKNGATVGIGAGQMSRYDSTRIATLKAQEMGKFLKDRTNPADGAVVASDAFFPFPDGLIAAVQAGVTAIIQPGGAIRDDEVIAAADSLGVSMIFTGVRHFRH
jgi:phosphoribosylaminoimidazolecarboxamide formyltransferase/IMP cyclohydrolase